MTEKSVFDTPQVAKEIRTAISTYMEACGTVDSVDTCDTVLIALANVQDEWEVLQDDLIDEEEDNDV